MLYTPQTMSRDHSAPGVSVIDSPSDLRDDYMDSPTHSTSPLYTSQTPLRRGGSVHILGSNDASEGGSHGNWSVSSRAFGTSSLAGMDRDEMMFKIKNTSSKDKLRGYINDLWEHYQFGYYDTAIR